MNAATDVDVPGRTYVSPTYQLTFAGLVRGELIKLVTVRSLVTLLLMTVLFTAGIGMSVALLTEPDAQQSAAEMIPTFVNSTLLGLQFSIFLVAVIGAVAGAGDFGNGTIQLAFGAAPRRTPVLAAKLTAIGGATGGLVGATVLLTAAVNWLALTPGPLWTPVTNLTSVLSAIVAVTGVSVSAVSLGCLLRSSAGAVFAILGLLIVVTIALMAVPAHLVSPAISNYSFGAAVTNLLSLADDTGRWVAAVVALVAWSVVLAGCAAVSIRRRDV